VLELELAKDGLTFRPALLLQDGSDSPGKFFSPFFFPASFCASQHLLTV
jgi:hypothetical protein